MKKNQVLNQYYFKVICLILLSLVPVFSKAQFFDALGAQKVWVTIKHAPKLGIKVDKVIFNVSGIAPCNDRVLSDIQSDFIASGATVIERDQLSKLLEEQKFSHSSYVDESAALQMGKITGASTMVNIKILDCRSTQNSNLYKMERKYDNNGKPITVRANIAKTSVFLTVSISTTDLTTAKVFRSHTLKYDPTKENKSYTGIPELPTTDEVFDEAYSNLLTDVHRLYFNWNEYVSLYFFDDKIGGLKEAYNALKSNDSYLAYEISKKCVSTVESNPDAKERHIAHANYNLGMCYFIQGSYDSALVYLKEAQRLRGGEIVENAIKVCNTAKAENLILRAVETKAESSQRKAEEQHQQQSQTIEANTLTNETIVSMVKKNLPKSIIISKITSAQCKFDTTEDGLDKLNKAGVTEDIILKMIEKGN